MSLPILLEPHQSLLDKDKLLVSPHNLALKVQLLAVFRNDRRENHFGVAVSHCTL